MRVELLLNEYLVAHGKMPRGVGSWAFCEERHYHGDNYIAHVWWFHQQTYAQAKKAALARARAEGVTRLVVCS